MEQSTIALIILVAIIILYATEIIPLAVTSVLGAIAMAATGIISYSSAISSFGSDTVMLVVGMLIIGNALFETGLVQKIGNAIVKLSGLSEKVMLAAVIVLAAVLSGFISNTATVAMFMPIIATAAMASNGRITKKNTIMALGFASVVGGNLTLVGSTPQLIAQGMLEDYGLQTMEFFTLSKIGIPLILVMLLYYMTIGGAIQNKAFRNFEENYDDMAIDQTK